jgi:sterol desaturase/sphingolipid hydroxylase (fatty acid hydroxylase superfamily)
LLIAIPIFLVLVLFEKWWGYRKGYDTVRNMDMISSLSSGITNVTKDVLGLSIIIISYSWIMNKIAMVHVNEGVLTYIIAFVALDFAGYWVHRISHEYNLFWNNHIVHHSSEEFNLACALRQSISSIVKIFAVFLVPAALLGVPEKVIAIVAPIQLFAQFWYHTRHINKMGFLEKIIVTPSHHRVHHAINREYIDKNYSQIFIIWDKLFGTFQKKYKALSQYTALPAGTNLEPITINFQHLWLLIKDAWHTKAWKDKLRIWFMPTGWRPDDVSEKYPVYKVEDVYQLEKYAPYASPQIVVWSWIQLLVMLGMICYLFGNIATIGSPNIFIYGIFIFLSVYSYTELMDRNPYALAWEIVKNIAGIAIIYYLGDWFGATAHLSWINPVMISWFILSTVVTAWFVFYHFKTDSSLSISV